MKYILATAALAAVVVAQDCQSTVSYKFEVSQANVTLTNQQSKRDTLERRVTTCTNSPVSTLKDGRLVDQDGSIGSILNVTLNSQYQYDPKGMTQQYALTSGFCVNSNNTLSHPTLDPNDIGQRGPPSAIFYNCVSHNPDGTVNSKLYGDGSLGKGASCSEVYLQVIECSGGVATEHVHNTGGATQPVPTGSATAMSVMSTTAVTTAATTSSAPAIPYPVGNATTPAAGGSAASSGSPVSTAGTSSTSPATYNPANGANVLATGSQVLAGVAAMGVFALF